MTTLVVGASGATGRMLVEHLLGAGSLSASSPPAWMKTTSSNPSPTPLRSGVKIGLRKFVPGNSLSGSLWGRTQMVLPVACFVFRV